MNQAQRKQTWMRRFAEAVRLLTPYRGPIDWDTATFLFYEAYTPAQAADRWLSIR